MYVCSMHYAIDYSWIMNQDEFALYVECLKIFTLSLYSWINYVWRNYHPQTANLTMCVKILFTDHRLQYLWSICLAQLIRWIHLILKPEKGKHYCENSSLTRILYPKLGPILPKKLFHQSRYVSHCSRRNALEYLYFLY